MLKSFQKDGRKANGKYQTGIDGSKNIRSL